MTNRLSRLIALGLLGLACLLCMNTYRYFGNTWDEPEHLAAGLQLLDHGLYTYDIQHPPLARLAMAIGPYLAGARAPRDESVSGEQPGREILYQSNHYDQLLNHYDQSLTDRYNRLLTLARLGVLPFFVVMVAAVWLWASRWFGRVEAIVACFLLITTPAILGHAAIAALDIPGTSLCILSMYLFACWLDTRSLRHALLFGFAAGLALGTKLYALPFLGITVPLMVVMQWLLPGTSAATQGIFRAAAAPASLPDSHPLMNVAIGAPISVARKALWSLPALRIAARQFALAGLLGVMAIILCYGGRFETLRSDGSSAAAAIDFLFGAQGALHDAATTFAEHVPLPLALDKFALGIQAVQQHNTVGHQSYLMGQVRSAGWWYFYPVVLALKTPIPLLILGVAGLIALIVAGIRRRQWTVLAPAVCCLALFGFCCFYSHINIGVRHVLFVYPFFAIAAAALIMRLWRLRRSVAVHGVIFTLLLWQGSVLYTAFPDYLAYFNAFAGDHPEHFVVDSDLDWGQDLRRLEHVLQTRDVHEVWLAYRGTAAPWLENLPPYKVLQPGDPQTGWIAISLLAKQESPTGYGWLRNHVPVQRVGKSIDLYYVPADIPDEALRRLPVTPPEAALKPSHQPRPPVRDVK